MFKGICFNFHCGLAMVGPQTYYSFLLKLSLDAKTFFDSEHCLKYAQIKLAIQM